MSHYDPTLRESAIAFPPAATRLGILERKVVTLSRRDTLASLAKGGRLSSALRRLFGVAGANRLADPRLETLRRYAVQLRHGGDALAATAAETLVAQGYSVDQIAHARWLVARERHGQGTTPARVNRVALACVILCSIRLGMAAQTAAQDRVIGLVIGLLAAATGTPLATMPVRLRRRRDGVAVS